MHWIHSNLTATNCNVLINVYLTNCRKGTVLQAQDKHIVLKSLFIYSRKMFIFLVPMKHKLYAKVAALTS